MASPSCLFASSLILYIYELSCHLHCTNRSYQGTTIQGFIAANRIPKFENSLKSNYVFKLKKFIVNRSKLSHKLSDHKYAITFTNQTGFDEVTKVIPKIDVQKFRTRLFSDFRQIADTKTHLYDVLGKITRITGDNLESSDGTSEESPNENGVTKDRVFLHLLMQDGETIRAYLWEDCATKFRKRWNQSMPRPSVLLLTAVLPKTIGGAVALSGTSASRLFFDTDVLETTQFIERLGKRNGSTPVISSASSAITKIETVMVKERNHFVDNEIPQTASFYCVGTIVDVAKDRGWNYVSCTGCSTKLELSGVSLECRTCKKINNVGVLRYRFEVEVHDANNDVANFVIFDSDGIDLV